MGTTIGAGIYALIGKVAGQVGMATPLAFLLASLLAAASAGSFAELSSRFPRSAGEAVYVREGFGVSWLATATGLLVVLAGSVSAATIANAFAGYLGELLALPRPLAISLLVLALAGLAGWGIRVSVYAAAAITLLEIGGLCAVLWLARDAFAALPQQLGALLWPGEAAAWSGVLSAALLAFYAFLGFEDMVNVAEEVRDVRRTLPLAIVLTLAVTTLLYALLASVAVLSTDPAALAASDAPLATVVRHEPAAATAISLIGVIAMVNGALIQVIMASRVLFGLAVESGGSSLARIHPVTRTPVRATALVAGGVLLLALAFPLASLAEATSVATLLVFTLVNAALLSVKRSGQHPPPVVAVPGWLPVVGFATGSGFLIFEAWRRVF